MIRLIQRRLIIPRGDTGTFSIPVLTSSNMGDVSIFTIFNPLTHKKIAEKRMELSDGVLTVTFSHGDTVNLPAGQYVWDIKFYRNPVFAGEQLIDGEEIDSYYAAFSLPVCEIRETGDSLLMDDDTPQAKLAPDQIDLISAAITATQNAKEAAVNSAADAETSASAAATSAQAALESKDAALASQTSAATSEDNAAESATAAQESATRAAQIAQQIHEEIPTKVSDLVDDSGHYTKPVTGIPASDLEETYLTEHQDLSNYVQKTDYATRNSAGIVKISPTFGIDVAANILNIARPTTDMLKAGNNMYRPVVTADQHTATFYGLAKAAGSDEKNSELPVGQYTDAAKAAIQAMLDVPSTADIPTNVSELTNDAGYLTEHQDISGKANSADLAAVATSGSYEDLSDKPTIPEVPVQDVQIAGTSILQNNIANIPEATSGISGIVTLAPNTNVISSTGGGVLIAAQAKRVAFYGLAKAAGDTTQSKSNNSLGTYTTDAKAAIQTMLDVPSNAAMTTAIGNAIGNINSFDMAVVQALPTEDISTHTIYLVPKTGETNDVYDEYVYINDAWEMVGNTQVDLSNYVQKTDYATSNDAGVVRIGPTMYTSVNGALNFKMANANEIKAGTSVERALTPYMQSNSTFYGLAKAAGDTTQSQSDNAVGTYTEEAKAAIQQMLDVPSKGDIPSKVSELNNDSGYLTSYTETDPTVPQWAKASTKPSYTAAEVGALPSDTHIPSTTAELTNDAGFITVDEVPDVPVQDVQVNGTSIVGANGVANVPAATKAIAGVVKHSASGNIKTGTDTSRVIAPANQHESTFYGLAKAAGDTTQSQSNNAVGAYTDDAKAAIQQMLDVPSNSDIPDVSIYATKADTVLETTLSRGRKEGTTIGGNSFAFGNKVEASGYVSFGIGNSTIASGMYSHAEGGYNQAIGAFSHAEGGNMALNGANIAKGLASHAEGSMTIASGQHSHTEGTGTRAVGRSSHTEGRFNVEDNYFTWNEWVADTEYSIGDKVKVTTTENEATVVKGYICKTANNDSEFIPANWNQDLNMNYVEIIGNGTADDARSNAYALDWSGNGHYMGNIYVGANADSTGGTKVLCEADFATAQDIQNIINGGAGA